MTIVKRPAFWVFAVAGLTVYTLIFFVARMPAALARPGLIGFAATIDLTVTVPVLCWFMLFRPGYARWPAVLITGLVGVRAALLLLPASEQVHLPFLGWVAVPIELWVIARLLRRLRETNGGRDALSIIHGACAQVIPYENIARIVASEIAVFYYALFSWRTQPESRTGYKSFHYAQASGWGTLPMYLAIAVVFEAFPVHLLLRHWSPLAAWICTGLDAYGLLWLVAMARAAVLRPILVGAARVLFRAGLIWEAEFSRQSVASCKRIAGGALPRRSTGYLRAVVMNDPEWLLEFRAPVMVQGLFGRRRAITRIGLAVDDPAAFSSAMHESNPLEIS
jgi:hypothetical protein